MNKMLKIAGLAVILGIFGCGLFKSKKSDQAGPEQLEDQKTVLLQKIERGYDDPESHYQLGKIYQNEGLYSRAEWEYTVALRFDPVHHRAMASKVKLYQNTGEAEKSRMAADLFINQSAASAQASSLLGRAFQMEGMEDYAMTCYQQALNLAPNSAALHKQIGYYYLGKGETVRAEEYLRRSVQLDPYQPEVAEQLGRMGVVIQVPQKVEKGATVDKAMSQ